MRRGTVSRVIQHNRLVVQESPATMPAIILRPESQCGQIRRSADRGPGVAHFPVVERLRIELTGEVDQQRTIGTQIRAALIDPPMEPLPRFKDVGIGAPSKDLNPPRRPPSKHHRHRSRSGREKKHPRRNRRSQPRSRDQSTLHRPSSVYAHRVLSLQTATARHPSHRRLAQQTPPEPALRPDREQTHAEDPLARWRSIQ